MSKPVKELRAEWSKERRAKVDARVAAELQEIAAVEAREEAAWTRFYNGVTPSKQSSYTIDLDDYSGGTTGIAIEGPWSERLTAYLSPEELLSFRDACNHRLRLLKVKK